MSTIRVNTIQDTGTNVAANISGGTVTFTNKPEGLGAGRVLQTAAASNNGIIVNNQNSTTYTGLAVSLTPKATSSKLIITYSSTLYIANAAQVWNSLYVNSAEDTTLQHQVYQSAGEHRYDVGGSFIYTPTNTNAVEFKWYLSVGSGYATLGAAGNQNLIYAQEIGG